MNENPEVLHLECQVMVRVTDLSYTLAEQVDGDLASMVAQGHLVLYAIDGNWDAENEEADREWVTLKFWAPEPDDE